MVVRILMIFGFESENRILAELEGMYVSNVLEEPKVLDDDGMIDGCSLF